MIFKYKCNNPKCNMTCKLITNALEPFACPYKMGYFKEYKLIDNKKDNLIITSLNVIISLLKNIIKWIEEE